MTTNKILYLSEEDVKQCMTMAQAVALSDKGINADAHGQVAGDKFYMHTGETGFIKPFSGYIADEEYAYVKTFSFYEGNRAKDLPPTSSMSLLFDVQTGSPVCIIESN